VAKAKPYLLNAKSSAGADLDAQHGQRGGGAEISDDEAARIADRYGVKKEYVKPTK
jgi:hypothetical protein